MGAAAKITEIYTNSNSLIERTREYLKENDMKIGELAERINYHRSTLNLFLTGRPGSPAFTAKLEAYLNENESEAAETLPKAAPPEKEIPNKMKKAKNDTGAEIPSAADTSAASADIPSSSPAETSKKPPEASDTATRQPARRRRSTKTPKKPELFVTSDSRRIMSVCQACQDYREMGIITGRSGFGKTFTLKEYSLLPRVAYIECDVTMGTQDLLKEIERVLGIPRHTYATSRERINGIVDFLSINEGWLLIVDEADKLLNKNTQSKMDILRTIFDRTAGSSDWSTCGIVIAGQPKLEALIKTYDGYDAGGNTSY